MQILLQIWYKALKVLRDGIRDRPGRNVAAAA
jgi:hypothetical protein